MMTPQMAAQMPPNTRPTTNSSDAAGVPSTKSRIVTPKAGIMRMMKMAHE